MVRDTFFQEPGPGNRWSCYRLVLYRAYYMKTEKFYIGRLAGNIFTIRVTNNANHNERPLRIPEILLFAHLSPEGEVVTFKSVAFLG